MKIHNIQFYNYRGFYSGDNTENAYNLPIEDGKNVLIYGENGSGKSSIFKGLKDFFQSSDSIIDFVKHNRWLDETHEAFIEIKFDDGTIIKFNEKSKGEDDETRLSDNPSFLSAANKLKGFLSYKNLLQTHFQTDKDDDGNINLFSLIVENILKDHEDGDNTILEHWESLKDEEIVAEPEDLESDNLTDDKKEELNRYNTFKGYLDNFNTALQNTLTEIEAKAIKLLHYFDENLKIKLVFNDIEVEDDKLINQVITPQITYFENDVINHEDVLNEARLSALAISIYFASILTTPNDNATFKVLFLDDIFIGLDTSNRIPLLKILKDHFADYQIFITTYDRNWFELAKKYLSGWETFELYSNDFTDANNQTFEIPVIINPSDDYITKAKKYRAAKDYAASSNYLRKGIEKLIKDRLSEEVRRTYDGKPHTLSFLWERLVERYNLNKVTVSEDIKTSLSTTRLVLLNPQSHDGLNFPIYEYELNEAFKVYEEIEKLPIIENIVILSKGTKLEFKHPTINYTLKFELDNNWCYNVRNGIICDIKPNCKLISFEDEKGVRSLSTDKKAKIDKFNIVFNTLKKNVDSSLTYKIFYRNTYVNENWKLSDVLSGYKRKNYSLWEKLVAFFQV